MGATPKEQIELRRQVAAAEAQVAVDALYAHYKSADKIYKVLGLGFIEANLELCVIYQAQYGERLTFLRPLDVWLETVEWDGQTVPRFQKID